MLYPATLSIFLRIGVTADSLPVVAGFFGCLCHLVSTFFVYESRAAVGPARGPVSGGGFVWLQSRSRLLCRGTSRHYVRPLPFPRRSEPAAQPLASVAEGKFSWGGAARRLVLDLGLWVPCGSGHAGSSTLRHCPGRCAVPACRLAVAHASIVAPGCRGARAGGGFLAVPRRLLATTCHRRVSHHAHPGCIQFVGRQPPGPTDGISSKKIHLPASDTIEGDNPARIESQVLYQRETAPQDQSKRRPKCNIGVKGPSIRSSPIQGPGWG